MQKESSEEDLLGFTESCDAAIASVLQRLADSERSLRPLGVDRSVLKSQLKSVDLTCRDRDKAEELVDAMLGASCVKRVGGDLGEPEPPRRLRRLNVAWV